VFNDGAVAAPVRRRQQAGGARGADLGLPLRLTRSEDVTDIGPFVFRNMLYSAQTRALVA
jgi:hypothetical protein